MGAYLDNALELLKDSEWHMIEEVKGEIPLQKENFYKIIDILHEYGFIDIDNSTVRITSKGIKILELPV